MEVHMGQRLWPKRMITNAGTGLAKHHIQPSYRFKLPSSLITAMCSQPPPSEQGDWSVGIRVGPEPVKEKVAVPTLIFTLPDLRFAGGPSLDHRKYCQGW